MRKIQKKIEQLLIPLIEEGIVDSNEDYPYGISSVYSYHQPWEQVLPYHWTINYAVIPPIYLANNQTGALSYHDKISLEEFLQLEDVPAELKKIIIFNLDLFS